MTDRDDEPTTVGDPHEIKEEGGRVAPETEVPDEVEESLKGDAGEGEGDTADEPEPEPEPEPGE